MNDTNRTVEMYLIHPGSAATNGEFTFELEPRVNAGRTVKFSLGPSDAEALHKALAAYLESQK